MRKRLGLFVEMGKLSSVPTGLTSPPPTLRPPPKAADPFYTSPEWRRLMASIKGERGAYCEDCGAGGPGVVIIGDHVVEIKDGGAQLERRNIRLRCLACHNRKTFKARGSRAAGRAWGREGEGG